MGNGQKKWYMHNSKNKYLSVDLKVVVVVISVGRSVVVVVAENLFLHRQIRA